MKNTPIIRPETQADYIAISMVNDLAFNRPNEGFLVTNLRKLDAFMPKLSLVVDLNNQVVGYALFFPIVIKTEDGEHPSLSLGPIAVLPKLQNQGIGGNLIITGHQISL
jgi:putative acetyltransferase